MVTLMDVSVTRLVVTTKSGRKDGAGLGGTLKGLEYLARGLSVERVLGPRSDLRPGASFTGAHLACINHCVYANEKALASLSIRQPQVWV